MQRITWVVAVLFALGCSKPVADPPAPPAPGPKPVVKVKKTAASEFLTYAVPPEWVSEEPANEMRKAQYRIPDRKGKAGDANLTFFTFGGPASSLESNVERWREQMGGADAAISKIQGSACAATLVDLTGNYAGDSGGSPIENTRFLGAIVEAGERTWYLKFVGPADTVSGWKDAYVEMIKGIRPIE